jgi:EPS-associated MarR family transcriptional regulator
MLTDEYRYKILKLVEAKPEISQRELARSLGISLGKTNFCLKALIERGLIKATNFRNNQNKLAYMYLLTPTGIEEKSTTTLRFLKAKIKEYELLQAEIMLLTQETKSTSTSEILSDVESVEFNPLVTSVKAHHS